MFPHKLYRAACLDALTSLLQSESWRHQGVAKMCWARHGYALGFDGCADAVQRTQKRLSISPELADECIMNGAVSYVIALLFSTLFGSLVEKHLYL
eukprot:6203099-Pleurochrysis_carterae.AAC.2